MLSHENTHVNCLLDSLLDHFVVTSKTPVIHKQKVLLLFTSFWDWHTTLKVVLLLTRVQLPVHYLAFEVITIILNENKEDACCCIEYLCQMNSIDHVEYNQPSQ